MTPLRSGSRQLQDPKAIELDSSETLTPDPFRSSFIPAHRIQESGSILIRKSNAILPCIYKATNEEDNSKSFIANKSVES